jgi:tetratricopeptide (TPR) repeat protein
MALAVDPDSVHAWLGICRLALQRRNYEAAVKAAGECYGRLYFYPMAHFLEGIAWSGLADYAKARDCLRLALSQNPHFPQAHLWLGRLLRFRFNDPEGAEDHFRLYREMRRHLQKSRQPQPYSADSAEPTASAQPAGLPAIDALPPLGDDVLVVSGLPRSGTSMLMQMLDAGGMPILTDHEREADQDNPKGYFEFEAVKKIFHDRDTAQTWVAAARGQAVKIVAPLVCSLPPGSRYRVILIERDYGEVLASQAEMIARRGESIDDSPERRRRLRAEYARLIERTKKILDARPDVQLLTLRHEDILREPVEAAAIINQFAGGTMDSSLMASVVDHSLHRNRRETTAGG